MFLQLVCKYRARRGASESTFSGNLCSFVHKIHKQKEYRLSLVQIFVVKVSILNSWWSANWLHIRCHKGTWRNLSEVTRNEGSMRVRPEWPWIPRKRTYKSWTSVQNWNLLVLHHLPSMLPIDQWIARLFFDAHVMSDEEDTVLSMLYFGKRTFPFVQC